MSQMTKERFGLMVALLLAVVVLAACSMPTSNPDQEEIPSQVPQPTQPADINQPMDTCVPTFTATPTNTAMPSGPTITPTPEADPRVVLGGADWVAKFGEETGQTWYQFADQQASVVMEQDKLVLTAFKDNSYEVWSMSYPILSDFYLEITGTSGSECAGKDRYGVIVRAPTNNEGYLFGISCDGNYRVRKWDGNEYTELVQWAPDEHIIPGPNQTHRIGFMAEGDHLSFYVNGFLLGEVIDDSYHEGTFGIFIAAEETPGFTVDVTEVLYWELP